MELSGVERRLCFSSIGSEAETQESEDHHCPSGGFGDRSYFDVNVVKEQYSGILAPVNLKGGGRPVAASPVNVSCVQT